MKNDGAYFLLTLALCSIVAFLLPLDGPPQPARPQSVVMPMSTYNPADSFKPAPFPEVPDMPDYANPVTRNPTLSYVPPPVEVDANMDGMPDMMVDPEINCIALTVFIEARGESAFGQALVASSVVNRARSLGIDECSVVDASGQYTGTLTADPWLIDKQSWERSIRIARDVRNGDYDMASCSGVTHFHNDTVKPHWSSDLNYACKVDGHTYYRMPQ